MEELPGGSKQKREREASQIMFNFLLFLWYCWDSKATLLFQTPVPRVPSPHQPTPVPSVPSLLGPDPRPPQPGPQVPRSPEMCPPSHPRNCICVSRRPQFPVSHLGPDPRPPGTSGDLSPVPILQPTPGTASACPVAAPADSRSLCPVASGSRSPPSGAWSPSTTVSGDLTPVPILRPTPRTVTTPATATKPTKPQQLFKISFSQYFKFCS